NHLPAHVPARNPGKPAPQLRACAANSPAVLDGERDRFTDPAEAAARRWWRRWRRPPPRSAHRRRWWRWRRRPLTGPVATPHQRRDTGSLLRRRATAHGCRSELAEEGPPSLPVGPAGVRGAGRAGPGGTAA